MNVKIRNCNSSQFNCEALKKTVENYCQHLEIKHDVVVSFDGRLTSYSGWHSFDEKNKRHLIKLNTYPDTNIVVFKYETISTILHELRHAFQKEKDSNFFKEINTEIKRNKDMSVHYSLHECDARSYENKYVNEAVDFYNKHC